MPYTVLLLVHRKLGLSTADFRHHYENVHVPLLKSLAGSLFPLSHTRQYTQTISQGREATDNGIDCVTEMQFETAADFAKFSEFLAGASVAPKVQEDCEAFMDPSKTTVLIREEAIKTTK